MQTAPKPPKSALMPYTSDALDALRGVRHGFFTREGGESFGLYESLNCSPFAHDDPDAVNANRANVAQALGTSAERLITLKQVHDVHVVEVRATDTFHVITQKEGDALVTCEPNIAIGVLTADCAPVLLADKKHGIVAAAHAGWKGALGGVIEKTVQRMEELGAARKHIQAAVGPCIGQYSYEVDAAFEDAFHEAGHNVSKWFAASPKPARFYFNLSGFVESRLHGAGVMQVDVMECDTYAQEELFFSYRRCCHRGKHDFGRQISAIMLDSD